MKKHFQYLWYVIRHKWFVFVECCKFGIPWLGIIHDWQKLTPTEWLPYVWTFWGPYEYSDRPEWLVNEFDYAWLHHQKFGKHHWQYWLLVQDSDEPKCLEMPYRYVVEMLSDWIGAGRAIRGKSSNPLEWYLDNRDKIQLHPKTRKHVETYLYCRYGV